MNWNYDPSQYEEKTFSIIPMGDHRVRIFEVEETTFSSGNCGYKLTLDVSGHVGKLFHNLVLNANDPKATNQRIGEFFNCFGITDFTMGDGRSWIGKIGAVRVKHEEYNGKIQPRVAYFINRSRQDKLPAWKEPYSDAAPSSAPSVGWSAGDLPKGW